MRESGGDSDADGNSGAPADRRLAYQLAHQEFRPVVTPCVANTTTSAATYVSMSRRLFDPLGPACMVTRAGQRHLRADEHTTTAAAAAAAVGAQRVRIAAASAQDTRALRPRTICKTPPDYDETPPACHAIWDRGIEIPPLQHYIKDEHHHRRHHEEDSKRGKLTAANNNKKSIAHSASPIPYSSDDSVDRGTPVEGAAEGYRPRRLAHMINPPETLAEMSRRHEMATECHVGALQTLVDSSLTLVESEMGLRKSLALFLRILQRDDPEIPSIPLGLEELAARNAAYDVYGSVEQFIENMQDCAGGLAEACLVQRKFEGLLKVRVAFAEGSAAPASTSTSTSTSTSKASAVTTKSLCPRVSSVPSTQAQSCAAATQRGGRRRRISASAPAPAPSLSNSNDR